MTDALPSGVVMHQPVELKMKDGSFPSTGAQVTFRLDQPLPADHQATIAYWNEQAGRWEGRATDISDDRRTVTAKLEHFSKYSVAETVYNGIGQVMGDKTSPPTCPGGKPSWADPTFNDDINGPVLWCVGTDAKNPDILEVHLKMNRSRAGSVTTGITPAWAWSDLWQNLTPITWTQMAADSDITSNVLGEKYLVQPLGEYRFGFNRKDLDAFWHDHPNQPLIEVGSSPVYAVAGLIYQAMGEKAKGGLAGVYIMTSLLQCGGSVTGAASDQSMKQTFGAVVSCMNDQKEAIAQGMARAWSNMNPGAAFDAKAAGASIGKAVSFAGDIYLTAKLTLSLGAFFGDLTVDPAARQLHFFPSNDEVKKIVASSAPQIIKVTPDYITTSGEVDRHADSTPVMCALRGIGDVLSSLYCNPSPGGSPGCKVGDTECAPVNAKYSTCISMDSALTKVACLKLAQGGKLDATVLPVPTSGIGGTYMPPIGHGAFAVRKDGTLCTATLDRFPSPDLVYPAMRCADGSYLYSSFVDSGGYGWVLDGSDRLASVLETGPRGGPLTKTEVSTVYTLH